MAKSINGAVIENERTEYGVDLGIEDGKRVVIECDDEADAYETLKRHLGGKVVTRMVFEVSWADAPDI